MIILEGTPKRNIIKTLSDDFHYENVYEKIKLLLTEDKELVHFFCRPREGYRSTNWEVTIPGIQRKDLISFEDLSEQEVSQVAAFIEEQKSKIVALLEQEKRLEPILEDIFYTPSKEDIKVVLKEGGIQVCLIQWGHRYLEDESKISPMTRMLTPLKNNKSNVIIQVRYTNGTIAPDKRFFIEYNGHKEFITNEEGINDLGKYLKGSTLVVYDLVNNTPEYHQSILVGEAPIYEVVFPLLTAGTVRVVNQKKEIVKNVELRTRLNGINNTYHTNDEGICLLHNLEAGKELTVTLPQFDRTVTFPIDVAKNLFEIAISEPIYAASVLKIVDQNSNPLAATKVTIHYQDKEQTYTSDSSGVILLNQFEVNNTISVREFDNENNHQQYILSEDVEAFIFEIEVPEPKFVQIRLLDHQNNPIPNTKINLALSSNTLEGITDKNGICTYPYEAFVDNEKIKAEITLVEKNRKGTERTKIVRKKIKFSEEVLSYDLKLRRIGKWWLLLLLMLLFIPYDKQVFVKVVDVYATTSTISNAAVSYAYHPQFWYKGDTVAQSTDSLGIANIGTLKTSGFSFLYALIIGTKAIISASSSTCYGTDTVHARFHDIPFAIDTIVLRSNPIKISLDFRVVDEEDTLPLPDVAVIIESVYQNKIIKDTALANINGRVFFNEIYKCSHIKRVYSTLYGYYPDSIINIPTSQITGDIAIKRTFKLRPQKNKIEFFVEDCSTKKRIAGALVTITVEGTNKQQTIRTNTHGQGRGFVDDVHILSDIRLKGEYHPFYDKGTLPKYKVETFINLPDSLRIICLPPKPNLIEFKNIDNYSQTPLAGVTNEILIKKVGSQEQHSIVSGVNGFFSFNIGLADTISIVSSYAPDYQTNDTTIRNILGEDLIKNRINKRTIPLDPQMVQLLFRTVEDDNLSQMIPQANIHTDLIVNGRNMVLNQRLQTDMNGEAVLELPVTALISISASKQGYKDNQTKVNGKDTRYLIACDQIERDIPLKKLPPPCNTKNGSGSISSVESYNMLDPNLKFQLAYDMDAIPDKMVVYCGHKDNRKQILFETNGFVFNFDGSPVNIDLSTCSDNTWITVVIIINESESSSNWSYSIKCL